MLWVQPEQLGNLPMPAADIPLLPAVLAALLATKSVPGALASKVTIGME